ncbi:MAG TPA: hypothetical protein VI585_09155 [Candidatus Binatia bacterium]
MLPFPPVCFVNQYGDGAGQRSSSTSDEVAEESVDERGTVHFEMTIGQLV